MPRWLLLILGVLILYLAPSLLLKVTYGQSFNILQCENCWIPDGEGGWQAKGFPDERRPISASENVPFLLKSAPIILSLLLILLFVLSPLARYVEREPNYSPGTYKSEKYKAEFVEISKNEKTEID